MGPRISRKKSKSLHIGIAESCNFVLNKNKIKNEEKASHYLNSKYFCLFQFILFVSRPIIMYILLSLFVVLYI